MASASSTIRSAAAGKPPGKIPVRQQYGALPMREDADGGWMLLLVTTRGRKRWSIPKGWPMRKRTAAQAAAQEAFEEGGVRGTPDPDPVGFYSYEKRLDGRRVPIVVDVFRLAVTKEFTEWPERSQRVRRWVRLADAAGEVAEPELAALLAKLAAD